MPEPPGCVLAVRFRFTPPLESTNATAFSRLEMNVDARGGADVRSRILERQMPGPITPVMQHLLGCAFDNPKDRDVDGDWIFAGRCGALFASGAC